MTGAIFETGNRETRQALSQIPIQSRHDLPSTFTEARKAASAMVFAEEQSTSRGRLFRDRFFDRNMEIAKHLPDGGPFNKNGAFQDRDYWNFFNHIGDELKRMRDTGQLTVDAGGAVRANTRAADSYLKTWPDFVAQYLTVQDFTEKNPALAKSDAQLFSEAAAEAKAFRDLQNFDLHRATTFSGKLGQFVGTAQGTVSDPAVALTIPIGPGRLAGQPLATAGKLFLAEAGVAMALEAPIQAGVYQFKREIQSPWTFKDAAWNVLAAGVGTGGIRATGSLTVDAASSALSKFRARPKQQLKRALSQFEGENVIAAAQRFRGETPFDNLAGGSADLRRSIAAAVGRTPGRVTENDLQSAASILQDYVDVGRENPGLRGADGERLHFDAVHKARADMATHTMPDVGDIVRDVEPDFVPPPRVSRETLARIGREAEKVAESDTGSAGFVMAVKDLGPGGKAVVPLMDPTLRGMDRLTFEALDFARVSGIDDDLAATVGNLVDAADRQIPALRAAARESNPTKRAVIAAETGREQGVKIANPRILALQGAIDDLAQGDRTLTEAFARSAASDGPVRDTINSAVRRKTGAARRNTIKKALQQSLRGDNAPRPAVPRRARPKPDTSRPAGEAGEPVRPEPEPPPIDDAVADALDEAVQTADIEFDPAVIARAEELAERLGARLEIPEGVRIVDGQEVVEARPAAEVFRDLDAERAVFEDIARCQRA